MPDRSIWRGLEIGMLSSVRPVISFRASRFARLINFVGVVFVGLVILMILVNLLRRNLYDPGLGLNLLVIAKDGLGVVAVQEGGGLISLTRLPDNLLIPIEPTGGEYRVEAIYKIGLPVRDSLHVSRVSVGQALGVVLGGVVKTEASLSPSGLLRALVEWPTQTNLSLFDRYSLTKAIRGLLTKRTSLEIAFPGAVTETVIEADGIEVRKLNSSIFVWSQKQWVVDDVLAETAEVAVINGSGREGKARVAARQMETAGVRVIDVAAAKETSKECLLWGDEKVQPKTYAFLRMAFSCQRGGEVDLNTYLDHDVKSDLVVVLGEKN